MKSPLEFEKASLANSSTAHRGVALPQKSESLPTCTSDFDYDLPEEKIAQMPLSRREASRLLVSPRSEWKASPQIFDMCFEEIDGALMRLRSEARGDFAEHLEPLVILNDSRVYRARIPVVRPYNHEGGQTTEAPVEDPSKGVNGEVFVLQFPESSLRECGHSLNVLLRPQKKLRVGDTLWANVSGQHQAIFVVKEHGQENCAVENLIPMAEIFDQAGEMPLPPYIRRQEKQENQEELDSLTKIDRERYQTSYADKIGSAAAPTAGLHFSEELLRKLTATKSARFAKITLHVGLGTFRPVQSEDYTSHHMHDEVYSVPRETFECLLEAVNNRRPVVFVGTTSFRAIESFFRELLAGRAACKSFEEIEAEGLSQTDQLLTTKLFVHPALSDDGTGLYQPVVGHALITNFHQPRSTLLMLVGSLIGVERMWALYRHALDSGYRFLSYGDGSLLRFARRGLLHDWYADPSKGQE